MLKWLRNRKFATQILASVTIIALLTAGMGFLAYAVILNLSNTSTALYEKSTLPVMLAGELTADFHEIAVNVRDMVTADEVADIEKYSTKISELQAEIDEHIAMLDPQIPITDNDIRASFDAFTAARADYSNQLKSVLNLARMNADIPAILTIQDTLSKTAGRELSALETMTASLETAAEAAAAASSELGRVSVIVIAVIAAVVFAAALLIGLGLSRMTTRPLKQALHMTRELSKGHLGTRLNLSGRSEIGQMAAAMDQFADYLQHNVVDAMQRIARGDVAIDLTPADGQDEITPALQTTVDSINSILTGIGGMLQNVIDGNMRARIDTSAYQGEWQKLAEGINKIIDEISAPISEASMVMSLMAEGNLSTRMTGQYKGDHEDFVKEPLNRSLDTLATYVSEIAGILTNMANSDLDQQVANNYSGDFAPIQNALNFIIYRFNKVLLDMGTAAEQVANGARQVSDGSQALSLGTTTQASSIQQLTASLSEIAAQTRLNAKNANEANELAAATRSNAIAGNERMKDMQKAMEEINVSSNSISKIIKVIDDIAFQTNILALNAAVEAARAGQHGKGFAVVAEEVRNLAARSASAAQETTALIEGSIKKVNLGTGIANATAAALDQIVSDITRSAALIDDIAKASSSQASAIAQINQGVEEVSRVVQSNSATAEQSAAASEELASQSDFLKQMISQFKISKIVKDLEKNQAAPASVAKTGPSAGNPAAGREEQVADYQRKMTEKISARIRAADARNKPKIALSDGEFGKF